MKHGKITSIEALKRALKKFNGPPVGIDTARALTVKQDSEWKTLSCAHIIYRTDRCGGHSIGVVKNADGSLHLEWGTGDTQMDNNILRAVKRIIAQYKREVTAVEKSYEEQESERQNHILSEQSTDKKQHITA